MTAQPGSGDALILQTVSKAFVSNQGKTAALQDVSLRIREAAVTALVGPDGAGKTTLLRLIAGLLVPDSGAITVFALDSVSNTAQIHQITGYMPQRFGLYEDLSVHENLTLYADLFGIDIAERETRFTELTRLTGLAKFNARLAGQLSGGMKQKLGLACTLVNRPRLLLLDEPSVGVDPVSRRELWHIIETLVNQSGTTVLLSTAYMDEAERCSDVILLDQGKVLKQGPPEAFHRQADGCSFSVSSPTLSKRQIQNRLKAQTDIIDTVIQGDAVRVVIRPETTLDLAAGFDTAEELHIEAVEPRLEDAFIMLLLARYPTANPQFANASVPITATQRETMIKVESVDRWFGSFQAVKKLSFNVQKGEIFGLLGANGAGKTTTFRMLCGLLPTSNGQLSVAGVDLSKAAAKARARIGYMSQKFSLYGQLSVRQNLDFFSSAYGLHNKQRLDRINWALQQFDLQALADSTSINLPLGYKQRLALACALMHEPEILFLDEPTSGIDPLARREFWARINHLAAQAVTVLVTTHFMEEAEYCDRLLIMREGDILASGTPAEIKRQSQSADQSPPDSMEEAFIRLVESIPDITTEAMQ